MADLNVSSLPATFSGSGTALFRAAVRTAASWIEFAAELSSFLLSAAADSVRSAYGRSFTRWAAFRPSGAERYRPFMPAPAAGKISLLRHNDITSLNNESLPVYQCVGNLAMCFCEQTAKSRPGNAHFTSSAFLVETFEVGQPHRLQLVEPQFDVFQVGSSAAGRLEYCGGRLSLNSSAFPGSGQINPPKGKASIMSICSKHEKVKSDV